MIPVHVRTVVLSGPREPGDLHNLRELAESLRAQGFEVSTPLDMARRAGATWNTIAYAREVARAILAADAVLLAPGWEQDDHAVASWVQATTFDLPVLEFDRALEDFVAVA